MGHPYQAVQWTRKKLIYDGILLALVMGYLVVCSLRCLPLS